jgi:hypothetical protein
MRETNVASRSLDVLWFAVSLGLIALALWSSFR